MGITILAIIEVVMGLIWLGSAAAILTAAGAAFFLPFVGLFVGGVLVMFAVIAVILGLASFLIAWGLWRGAMWAWSAAIILAVLGVILGLLTLPSGIITIIISILIIYYLTRPHVKAFYGKL